MTRLRIIGTVFDEPDAFIDVEVDHIDLSGIVHLVDVDGEAVLVNWSLTWARPERNRPIDAELTFVSID